MAFAVPAAEQEEVGAPHRVRRSLARLFSTTALVLSFALTLPQAAVAQAAMGLEARAEQGFGRLVLTFPKLPKYDVRTTTGVLVISFDEPQKITLDDVTLKLSRYLSVARVDPDGRGLRFALVQPLRINTMEAGEQLFIDLLPRRWSGPLPPLPEEVAAELARRAAEEERLAREARLREEQEKNSVPIELAVGNHPTFSRISLGWPTPFEVELSREGSDVRLRFDRYAKLDLTRLKVDPPPGLISAESRNGERGLEVDLKIGADTRLRAFREGATYVVDLTGAEATLADPAAILAPASPPSDEVQVDAANAPAPKLVESAPPAEGPPSEAAPGPMLRVSETPLEPAALEPEELEPADPVQPATLPQEIQPAAVRIAGSEGASTVSRDLDGLTESQILRVGAERIGDSLRLNFPFPQPTAAAVAARANVVWMTFDTPLQLDLRRLTEIGALDADALTLWRASGSQTLRVTLPGPALVTATPDQASWLVTIGDQVIEPTAPLTLERFEPEPGRLGAAILLAAPGEVRWFDDPVVGDRVAFVTAKPPARGFLRPREHVEFDVLASAHGVAVMPHVDDLEVALAPSRDRALVSRPGGLVLTREGEAASDLDLRLRSTGQGASDQLDIWSNSENGLLKDVTLLENAVSNAAEPDRPGARLALARRLLTGGLAHEASAVLRLAAAETPELARDPVFMAVQAIADVLTGRLKDARRILSGQGFANDLSARLWQGLADVQDGRWRDATLHFAAAEPVARHLPPELQVRFRLDAAKAALETKDVAAASRHLKTLAAYKLEPEQSARSSLLEGRLSELLGQVVAAADHYAAAVKSDVRPVAAEAEWRRLELQAEHGTVAREDAIERLETLIVVWRGDDIELNAMRALAELSIEVGRPRRAFELMKSATLGHPEGPALRDFQDRMRAAFVELFVDGKADAFPPVEALALFYDFRELTPPGRQGDEMIRRLADRLVEVDLLEQATALLDHQVAERLRGAARAQVAAKLALVHLMNRKPERALKVLRETRQPVLPASLQRQRTVLEARALGETGRADLARELLQPLEGEDIERVRSDVLWRAEQWREAAEEIEKSLGGRWQDGPALSDIERDDVMRAAIGYALEDDEVGLARLRGKFSDRMGDSPDASAFRVVTAPIAEREPGFQNMIRQIAQTDTLAAFLADYRARYREEPLLENTELPQS